MVKFHKDASIHPRTVTEMSKAAPSKQRRKSSGTPRKRSPIKLVSFDQITHAEVRKTARKLSKNNIRLVEILGGENVIIHNHPNWKKK